LKERFTFSFRAIDNQIDRATLRTTLTYSIFSNLQAGVEYNPLAGSVSPLANLRLLGEGRRRPAIILGTSSDRIGTPTGQSFYLTISKDLTEITGIPVAPYVGVAHGTFDDKMRAVGGMNINFPRRISSLLIFDGVHFHPTLNYTRDRHFFSLLLVRSRDIGFSYSIRF
jgi:hypothetical protein